MIADMLACAILLTWSMGNTGYRRIRKLSAPTFKMPSRRKTETSFNWDRTVIWTSTPAGTHMSCRAFWVSNRQKPAPRIAGRASQFLLVSLCWKSGLAVAAQDVDQLVLDQLLDVGAGGLQVLAGVELVGVLVEELADGAGHGQAQVGVNVDLAHGAAGGLTKLLLGDANGVGHLAAVLVDHLHILLGHG